MPRYFAYGSNMNPERVRERGLRVMRAEAARLPGFCLVFDKASPAHPGVGHANVVRDRAAVVEGVLYWLADERQILKMDPFERAPVNYSRERVEVLTDAGPVWCWTYFANPAVRRPGLRPSREYLAHLLAGRPFLSPAYYQRLAGWACRDGD
jgi:hypothetical protein